MRASGYAERPGLTVLPLFDAVQREPLLILMDFDPDLELA